jgi:hypothetical protein
MSRLHLSNNSFTARAFQAYSALFSNTSGVVLTCLRDICSPSPALAPLLHGANTRVPNAAIPVAVGVAVTFWRTC